MRSIIITTILLLLTLSVQAAPKRIMGWLETIRLTNDVKLKAKLDTGAKTSSIYAKDIVEYERDHERWVSFKVPTSKGSVKIDRPILGFTKIKQRNESEPKNGVVTRIDVSIKTCIGKSSQNIIYTLADRENFNYPVLLGRRALIKLGIIVDPGLTFTSKALC